MSPEFLATNACQGITFGAELTVYAPQSAKNILGCARNVETFNRDAFKPTCFVRIVVDTGTSQSQ